MTTARAKIRATYSVAMLVVSIYLLVAHMAFMWRNPTANPMSIYRDFRATILWKKLPKYQTKHTTGDLPCLAPKPSSPSSSAKQ